MTVGELKVILEDYDDELEVAIGEYGGDIEYNASDYLDYNINESDIDELRVEMTGYKHPVRTLVIWC